MDEIKLLNDAFRIYNLKDSQDISKRVLDYILSRLLDNKENFETMIEMLKEDISFDDIINFFKEAYKEEDFYKQSDSYKQGVDYYSGAYPVPIGNILVETNDVLDVIKYFVGGIKSRNTITISQTEYYELSLSNMVLIIFAEALAKFNISRNTLMILPFEECYPEEFDETVVIEDGKTDINQKKFSTKCIIYVDNHDFDKEINEETNRLKENNVEFELTQGSLDEAIEKIKKEKPTAASIYTKDPEKAYEFITLANSQNVFVNSSLLNKEDLNEKINKFYYVKKVMYPSGKEFDLEEYIKEYTKDDKEIKTDIFENKEPEKEEKEEFVDKEETALTEVVNPWYKRIFEKIKEFFNK